MMRKFCILTLFASVAFAGNLYEPSEKINVELCFSMDDLDKQCDFKCSDGANFSLSSCASDNVVIVNYWASYCGYCTSEMKYFSELMKRNIAGLKLVMVSTDGSEGNNGNAVLENNGIQASDSVLMVRGSLPDGCRGVPHAFVFFKGKLVGRVVGGPMNWNSDKTVDFLKNLTEDKCMESVGQPAQVKK